MFWRHEVQVPPGFEAVVNGRIEQRKPLRVGTYDQIHFVNFAPYFAEVEGEAASSEGIIHEVKVVVKLECPRSDLVELLRDSGDSTYRNVVKVSVQELATRQNLADSIRAAVQTYTQTKAMFDLTNLEHVRQELQQRIKVECTPARLLGEVVSCEVTPIVPETTLLAQLAARAGVKEVVAGDARIRQYSDARLGAIVEYFLETLKQRELIDAEAELARADAERARVEAQKQIAVARADVKMVELEQENRIATLEAQLQEEEGRRQQAAQERNASIKENAAAYEFTYKSRRLEEDKSLAQKELEVAKAKTAQEAALREIRRLDVELELERERELARIRAEEKAGALGIVSEMIEKLAAIPTTDYRGVHTLITGLGSGESREFATGLVLGLLSRAAEAAGLGGHSQEGEGGNREKTGRR